LILVDTNVLFDIVTDDAEWFEWSRARLDAASLAGPIAINDVIFAELSVRHATLEALEFTVAEMGLEILAVSKPALFLAGKAFARYRRAGGTRTSVLPDFFIGAQASVLGVPLLTRDARRYRTYFPQLQVIAP
jgi:predicted nucleic acid-binding protein